MYDIYIGDAAANAAVIAQMVAHRAQLQARQAAVGPREVRAGADIYIYIYIYICTCMYVYMYIYIYIYICIYL
jgi:hypothetical protein